MASPRLGNSWDGPFELIVDNILEETNTDVLEWNGMFLRVQCHGPML